jgi:hypothetical protein
MVSEVPLTVSGREPQSRVISDLVALPLLAGPPGFQRRC